MKKKEPTRPFTVRLENKLIDMCNTLGVNKTHICRQALEKAVKAKQKKES